MALILFFQFCVGAIFFKGKIAEIIVSNFFQQEISKN